MPDDVDTLAPDDNLPPVPEYKVQLPHTDLQARCSCGMLIARARRLSSIEQRVNANVVMPRCFYCSDAPLLAPVAEMGGPIAAVGGLCAAGGAV